MQCRQCLRNYPVTLMQLALEWQDVNKGKKTWIVLTGFQSARVDGTAVGRLMDALTFAELPRENEGGMCSSASGLSSRGQVRRWFPLKGWPARYAMNSGDLSALSSVLSFRLESE